MAFCFCFGQTRRVKADKKAENDPELEHQKDIVHISNMNYFGLFLFPPLGCMSTCLCSCSGMFKLMLIPELVRKDISFYHGMKRGCMENDPAKDNLGERAACM